MIDILITVLRHFRLTLLRGARLLSPSAIGIIVIAGFIIRLLLCLFAIFTARGSAHFDLLRCFFIVASY